MALHDLTLQSVEHYGGIDLKNNYKKYFSSSLGISIALHCIVIFFYIAWNWFSQEDETKIPRIRVHSLTELQAPPSLNEQQDIPLNAAPPPSADVVKPNFGVPVPVPDAVAPTVDFQDLNKILSLMSSSPLSRILHPFSRFRVLFTIRTLLSVLVSKVPSSFVHSSARMVRLRK